MRKLAVVVLTVALTASAAWAVEQDGCSRDSSNFGDELKTFTAQEQFTVPMSGPMQVTAARNGGVKLIPGSGSAYEVTVCKYAGAENETEGDGLLKQIAVQHSSSAISVQGPEGHHWVASLIVRVPQGASMSVSAHNGPVSAKDLSGTFRLDTVNGPISVKRVSGKVMATAKNGPISFHGNAGDYSLETQNGPISIDLENQSWDNGKLEARANNGPISLAIPKAYRSGIVVSSDGHSPMSCNADVCNEARKTWNDNERRIEFGSNPVIRISTHNGPVSVGTSETEAEM
ncbi:MAG TPA: hypothetical protein VG897_11505 [Terriglobales bacterium]|nr:hypothetical protein [Terriglobales bacterium]